MAQTSTFRWQGRAWLERSKAAARQGTQLALEHILAEAKKIVPLDEGVLERSGVVSMAPTGPTGAIIFDTPYAVVQHEDLTFKHLPGRTAKYLEIPMNTQRETALAIVAAEIRKSAFLGGRLG